MELSVRLYTDPILHQPCEPVTEYNQELLDTLGQMVLCMHKNHGIGLAANQVGINKQFCVVALEEGKSLYALINPKILSVSKTKEKMKEGCLSCPGVSVTVKRPTEIIIEYYDLSGIRRGLKLTDMDARIVQHELDHLQGKVITDKSWKLFS